MFKMGGRERLYSGDEGTMGYRGRVGVETREKESLVVKEKGKG